MRRLWTDIIAPAQAVVIDMHLRGIRIDLEARKELQEKAEEEKKAYETEVLGIARRHVAGAMPPVPDIAGCEVHPDFSGATPRNQRGSKRCDACVAIYEGMRDWRNSSAVKKAKRLADFKPGSKDQVGWLLFEALKLPVIEETDSGRPRVTLGVLEELEDKAFTSNPKTRKLIGPHLPLLASLIKLAHVQHRISVDLNPIIGPDGRAHPIQSLDATAIGRNRSGKQDYDIDKADEEGFNYQNVPDEVRRIYIADEGHWLISADAAQIEWALMMLYARCRRAVEAYAAERDIHVENARDIVVPTLLEEKWEDLFEPERRKRRKVTKSFTHGVDYGEGDANLAGRFKVTRERSKAARAAYFEAWPEIPRWQHETEQEVISTRALRNCFGRQRRFLDVTSKMKNKARVLCLDRKQLKEALAFRPASTNGDIWKLNARKLYDMRLEQLMGTHDDHLLQDEEPDAAVPVVKEACEEAIPELADWNDGEPWCPRFDVRVGKNWGDWDEDENPEGLKPWS